MPDRPPPPSSSAGGQRHVLCAKLGRELPGLPAKPFPTELGQRIYDSISLEAWKLWLAHSQMVINEKGLRLSDPSARELLVRECESFLFGAGSAPPAGWVPPAGTVQIKKKP